MFSTLASGTIRIVQAQSCKTTGYMNMAIVVCLWLFPMQELLHKRLIDPTIKAGLYS